MDQPRAFQRFALLMGALWIPGAICMLMLCFALGWGGMDYWHTQTFFALSLVALGCLIQEGVAIRHAISVLKMSRVNRTGGNVLSLALGAVVILFGIVLLVGSIAAAFQNLRH